MSNIVKIQTNDNLEQVVSQEWRKLHIKKIFAWLIQTSRLELRGETHCTCGTLTQTIKHLLTFLYQLT